MSFEALGWAFDQPVTPAAAKFVLVALANYADGSGWAFPGQGTLAQRTGQDERSVRRHLKALEDQGFIVDRVECRRQNGTRTSDAYLLNWPDRKWSDCPPDRRVRGQPVRAHRKICQKSADKLSRQEPLEEPLEKPKGASARDRVVDGSRGAALAELQQPNGEAAAGTEADDPAPDTPANAHWKAKQPELEHYFDKARSGTYRAWIKPLIPDKDDGQTLTLLCGSAFELNRVNRDYRTGIGKIVGRNIELHVAPCVKPARRKARQQADGVAA